MQIQGKVPSNHGPGPGGFTLVEIIGVVALVAVLAAVLVPRVASVMGRGKVNAAAQALAGLKTATEDYLSVNSSLPYRSGTGVTNGAVREGRFDADLVAGGYLEQLFRCPLGLQDQDASSSLAKRTHLRSVGVIPTVSGSASYPSFTTIAGYFDLDRNPASQDMTSGQMLVTAYIPDVPIAEAIALNRLIDGDSNSGGSGDNTGRCLYSSINNSFTVLVVIYITHY
ncbi:MAG: hypothetical protein IT580_10515 [Verrucomicrobiales bacterium]|nr:hypothetical protein [Verrucomicrobiales bacterium]